MKKISKLIVLGTTVLGINSVNALSQEKPNVVVIYVDDLGYGDLSCYGATEVNTPNVDKLAAKGIRFTDGHCSASTCTPSRFSLLTGSYAFRQNAAILPGDAPMLIKPGSPTLPSMLQKNGYSTAVIGKWHLGLGDGNVDWNGEISPGPLEIGFDYSYLIPATGDRVPCVVVENHHVVNLDPDDPISVSYKNKVGDDPTGIENPELLKYGADKQHAKTIVNGVSRIGYMSGGNAARWKDETIPYLMLMKARRFIDDSKDNPFFLYFAFHDIHVPHMPGEKFQGKTKMGYRGDAIVQMDYITGKLMEYLEEKGLSKNTLILFSSDNGPVLSDGYDDQSEEKLGDHKPAGPYRGGKYSAFEAGTRVPTIVRWPAKIKAGQVSDALFSHIDLYATVAAIIGQELEEGAAPDSENQYEALIGNDKIGRRELLEESYTYSLRIGNLQYIQPVENINKNSWIKNTKNIEPGFSVEPQLYDVVNDKGETNNIAVKNKSKVKKMDEKINEIMEGTHTR